LCQFFENIPCEKNRENEYLLPFTALYEPSFGEVSHIFESVTLQCVRFFGIGARGWTPFAVELRRDAFDM
jgi:hypothetical protein